MQGQFSAQLEKEMDPLKVTSEKLEQGAALLASDEHIIEEGHRELNSSMQQLMRAQDALSELPQGGEEEEEPSLEDLIVFDNKASKQ